MSTEITTAAAPAAAPLRNAQAAWLVPANQDEAFKLAERLANSELVPQQFRGKPADCLLALSMSHSLQVDPLALLPHIYVVQGRPALSSQFLIARVQQCGRYVQTWYETDGEGDDYGCRFCAKLPDGREVFGPVVTIGMAKAEGWLNKRGSKWLTMPDLMLRYRAGAFFARTECPDLMIGAPRLTVEEVMDISPDGQPQPPRPTIRRAVIPKVEQVDPAVDVPPVEPSPQPQPAPTVLANADVDILRDRIAILAQDLGVPDAHVERLVREYAQEHPVSGRPMGARALNQAWTEVSSYVEQQQ